MADLSEELQELHASVVRTIKNRVELGGEAEDLRLALQLLKQNSITASLAEADTQAMKSKMAGKLNFSTLQEKVVPIRPPQPVDAAPLPKPAREQSA
jgi:hypothetical protein